MADPFVRVDVWTLTATDPILTAYADAVAAMMAKPISDPTSWGYLAGIHGFDPSAPLPAGMTQLPPQWNQCQHYSWYFLPWHRMFVYYFELIVRAQVIANGGPGTWALPYWNYDGGGQSNTLPLAFRSQFQADGTTPNPLYTTQRKRRVNTGSALPATDISLVNAFDQQTFTGLGAFGGAVTPSPVQFFLQNGQPQSGALENTPHNTVHDDVGGPSGLMGSPYTAALDPIFWLHHANIDRLWGKWLQQSAQNTNPSDPGWLAQAFLINGNSGFTTASGAVIPGGSALTSANILDTSQLGYSYDDDAQTSPGTTAPAVRVAALAEAAPVNWPSPWPERPAAPASPAPDTVRHLVGATDRPIRLTGEPVTVTVPIDERVTASLRADRRAQYTHHVYLDIEGIDADRNPGQVYGVFVNLPAQPTDADLMAHHAGNISLFGIEMARRPPGDRHPHNLRISLDITRLLDRLAADGTWTDGSQLQVTLRPSTLGTPGDQEDVAADPAETAHPEVPITIGRISVHYA